MISYISKAVDKGLPLFIIIFTIMQIVFSNELVHHAKTIDDLDKERRKLSEENDILRQKIAELTSFMRLEKDAKELGFVKPTKITTIDDQTFTVALQALK